MIQTHENDEKPNFGTNLGTLAQIQVAFFSPKIWLCQLPDIVVSYHHVQYQKKLKIQSWESLVADGRTDGRTDSDSDFIGRCPTNVERPIPKFWRKI